MMSLERESQYYCEMCKKPRRFKINHEIHSENISKSKNGLVLYSDIHLCKDGLLGVNNLRIDANYAIRSFENQELPPVRKPSKFAIPGIPSSTPTATLYTKLSIAELQSSGSFRIIIEDEWLTTKINIGKVDETEIPVNSLMSDLGGINLNYYLSDINYMMNLEKWFAIFINSLELLPPTRFGLVIETLRYLLKNHEREPSSFDTKYLRTMLASHEIYFKAVDDPGRFDHITVELSTKYKEREISTMMELLAHLEMHPSLPLQYYTKTHKHELEYLIYLFLIMEVEGLIIVDRPGIVDST